jgi:predicted kinase
MESKIQVLCGMICSCKSTYCKNAAKNNIIILNDDDIVKTLHGGDYTLYDKKIKLIYKSVENQIISSSLAMGRSVIVDRGLNISIKGRKRWIALANSFDILCEAIIFKRETPEIHATRRYYHDNRGHTYEYWLKVAQHHNSIYNEPTLEEGFDSVKYISFKDIQNGVVI